MIALRARSEALRGRFQFVPLIVNRDRTNITAMRQRGDMVTGPMVKAARKAGAAIFRQTKIHMISFFFFFS